MRCEMCRQSTRATQRTLAPRCSYQTVILQAAKLTRTTRRWTLQQQPSWLTSRCHCVLNQWTSEQKTTKARPEATCMARSLNVDKRRGRVVTEIALGLKKSHYRIPTTRELRAAWIKLGHSLITSSLCAHSLNTSLYDIAPAAWSLICMSYAC
jgi:hypothetical protein